MFVTGHSSKHEPNTNCCRTPGYCRVLLYLPLVARENLRNILRLDWSTCVTHCYPLVVTGGNATTSGSWNKLVLAPPLHRTQGDATAYICPFRDSVEMQPNSDGGGPASLFTYKFDEEQTRSDYYFNIPRTLSDISMLASANHLSEHHSHPVPNPATRGSI